MVKPDKWLRLPGCRVFKNGKAAYNGRAVVVYIPNDEANNGLCEMDGVKYRVVRSYGPEGNEPEAERWTIEGLADNAA